MNIRIVLSLLVLPMAALAQPADLSQDGDTVWFAATADAISKLDEVLTAPADNGGHH